MSKLIMIPKLLWTSFILALFAFSCTNSNPAGTASGKSWFDSTVYPGQRFSAVTLFVLDASQKTTISTDSGTFVDTSVLEYVGGAGYSFINKAGEPKSKNFKSYKLDLSQIQRLETFLLKQPCTDSVQMSKTCAPEFRNVFVFYNENKKAIAQVHICFQCELSVFNPNEDYMCDFDNKVSYRALKQFVDSIKQVQ